VYAGGHKGGIKYGIGQYCYKETAIVYDGDWHDNMRHGKGELTFLEEKGAKFTGTFDKDEIE